MIEQRTPEWHAARCGKATASRIADIIAKTRNGWGAQRANYAAELVAERLSGVQGEGFCNAAMRHGTETEPQARAAYSFRMDVDVVEVGFVVHPSIPMSGASPDGLVGDDGLVEIKCPNTATHIDTMLRQRVPEKYVTQILWQLACTGRQWCDYVSYDPRLPETMRLFVQRVERDDEAIQQLEADVSAFLAEVETTVSALREIYEPQQKEAA